jgi:hypothetical protein
VSNAPRLFAPNGRPLYKTEGPTGRRIILEERIVEGEPRWGFNCGEMEDREFVQVLANAIASAMQLVRSRKAEAKVNQEVQGVINQMNKETK